MIKSLFRLSVTIGLTGMALGIFMGIRQDFVLAPAHAHLNLVGFVTLFLSALYYRVFPQAATASSPSWWAVRSRFSSAWRCLRSSSIAPRDRPRQFRPTRARSFTEDASPPPTECPRCASAGIHRCHQ
jgi:hypothetical protein